MVSLTAKCLVFSIAQYSPSLLRATPAEGCPHSKAGTGLCGTRCRHRSQGVTSSCRAKALRGSPLHPFFQPLQQQSEPRPCLEPWGQVVCLDSGSQGTHQKVWLGWCLPPNPPKFEERRHQAPSIARLIPTHGISLEAISKKGISDQSV